jgi:Pao retrotransposon peptidase
VVLSAFDPLGFVAPVVFTMKVVMQKVCGSNVNFDEKVPEEFFPESGAESSPFRRGVHTT